MNRPGANAMKKVLRLAVNSIITLFIAAAAAVVILMIAGIRAYVVKTGSMEPAIMTGSICLVDQKAKVSDIKTGDIITFRISERTVVTHRAVRIRDGMIYTKGDANNIEDEEAVTSEELVGKCILSIKGAGKVLKALRSPFGIVSAAMLIVILIAADHILDNDDTHTRRKKQ
ncbi:MAG: signal peptidase I [Ruminococcus sp.]|nr:signal peptidase I [Ruminococcus sp.]